MKLAQLLDRVHDEFPAVPKLVALRALADAAKEFCTRSHAWQETLDALRVRSGDAVVELDFDSGVMLAGIKDVRIDGKKVGAYAAEIPRSLRRSLPAMSFPAGYLQHDVNAIELVPAISQDAQITVTAALTLRLNAYEVEMPDGLIDEYGSAIAAGAKAKLVIQASQPWYAPDSAVAYAGPFYTAINTAKRRVMTSLGDAELRVAMREWV